MKKRIQKFFNLFGYQLTKRHKTQNIQYNDIGTKNLLNREIWLQKTLQSLTAGSSILDAGAGELKYKKYCTHLNYVSQDFGKYDGTGDGTGKQTGAWDNSKLDIVSDITKIPLENDSMDAIMCIEVFEHIPEPIAALKELVRIIKPNGKLIITAPFASLTHFSPYHYYSGFNFNFYKYWSKEFGLIINEITPNGSFYDFLAQEINRIPNVAEMYNHYKLSPEEKQILKKTLPVLQRLKDTDNRSYELLCFGYHVLAEKQQL
jgi:ubiquinone/menaquinone biosynthesis C-methylase UbiE